RRLAEQLDALVEQRHRAVLHLVNDGRVGAAGEIDIHLLGGRHEAGPDDLSRDWIDHALTTRLSRVSTFTVPRGGTTVVQDDSSMTAGPSKRCPGWSRARA